MELIGRLLRKNAPKCAVNEINGIIDGYDKLTSGGDESEISPVDIRGRILFCEHCQHECEVKYAGIGKRWFQGRNRSALVNIPKDCTNPAVRREIKLGTFVRRYF